ncbi:MAG: hypothetical protein V5A84_03800 [Planctomycetota bacterium]
MKAATGWHMTIGAVLLSAVIAIGVSCSAEHPSSEHPQGTEHPQSQEHPEGHEHSEEHPEGTHQSEHPESEASHEHPEQAAKRKPVTKERMANAIEDYVREDMKLKGNYFMFFDAKENRVLTLKLDHVHRERVAQTADNRYFVCADFRHVKPGKMEDEFRSKSGKVFDLDFWMKRGKDGELKVTEITLHKEAGEPRYTWYEEDGVWKRRKAN